MGAVDHVFIPDNMVLISTSITFAGVLVAVLLIWVATRNPGQTRGLRDIQARAMNLEQAIDRLNGTQHELSRKLQSLADGHQNGQEGFGQAIGEKVDQMSSRFAGSLGVVSDEAGRTFDRLGQGIDAIKQAQDAIAGLARAAAPADGVLLPRSDGRAFGDLGLAELVQQALPGGFFKLDTALPNGHQVACLITLPAPLGPLAIDGSFSTQSFRTLIDSGSEAQYEVAAAAFRTDLLKHVADVADHAIVPGETADQAMLYLATESVYAAIHSEFMDVVEQAYRSNVWIVSPTTLLAALRAMGAAGRDAKTAEQAELIAAEADRMAVEIDEIRHRLSTLQADFEEATGDLRRAVAKPAPPSTDGNVETTPVKPQEAGEAAGRSRNKRTRHSNGSSMRAVTAEEKI